MLGALTILLVFQLLGEAIAHGLDLPIPGPVIGFALLFVPAGVGVMVHLSRLREEWLPISVALVVSTVLTIACTALAMRWLIRVFSKKTAS